MELLKLNGTEKQIAWAEEIREKCIKVIVSELDKDDERYEQALKKLEILINKITDAYIWIDYKDELTSKETAIYYLKRAERLN